MNMEKELFVSYINKNGKNVTIWLVDDNDHSYIIDENGKTFKIISDFKNGFYELLNFIESDIDYYTFKSETYKVNMEDIKGVE